MHARRAGIGYRESRAEIRENPEIGDCEYRLWKAIRRQSEVSDGI